MDHMTPMFHVRNGRQYRVRMRNASDDINPVPCIVTASSSTTRSAKAGHHNIMENVMPLRSGDSPPGDALRCKVVRSGTNLEYDLHQPSPGKHDSRASVHRRIPAVPWRSWRFSRRRPCRRRNAAARARPHCRQRQRCSLRSIRRLSGVSGCPLPQWFGISSRRILRRSVLGKWTTALLLVDSTPSLPS
jgi:hypothetical protein